MATIADIVLAKGREAANARRQSANIWGQTIAGLSQIPGAIMADRDEQRVRQAAAQRQAQTDRRADTEVGIKVSAENRAIADAQAAEAERQRGREAEARGRAAVASWLNTHGTTLPEGAADRIRATIDLPGGLAHVMTELLKAPEPYTLSPGQQRRGPNNEIVADNPVAEKPEKLTFGAVQPVMVDGKRTLVRSGSDGALYDLKGNKVQDAAPDVPPQTASQDIVQVMGPNGVPVWTRKSDAVGQPAAQAARAVTGQERGVLAFYNRAKEAVETITAAPDGTDSLEQKIAKSGLMAQGRLQMAPNFLQSQANQSYRQAQRAFTEARLRKESGAAIPPAEYENDAKTYFAQPGDDDKIVEQKRAARQTVLEGLKFSAGKAYEEYYGEPNISPARRGTAAGPKEGDTKPIDGFPGTEQTFRGGKWIRTK